MKAIHLFFMLLGTLSITSQASPLRFSGLDENWTAHIVKPGSPEALFSGNAEAVINIGESHDNAEASIYVNPIPLSDTVKLAGDPSVWHKVLFPKPGTVKFKVVNEDTYQVNGQWRYIIEYQAETGTALNSVIMLMVSDGKLHAFSYEQRKPLYDKHIKTVRQMFKTVKIATKADKD